MLPARVAAYPPWTPRLGEGAPLGVAAYVVSDPNGYFVVGVDGSARRLPEATDGYEVTSPVLSPDGTKLAYGWSVPERGPGDPREAGHSALRTVDLGSDETTQVSLDAYGAASRYESVAWSRDGKHLAALATRYSLDESTKAWARSPRLQVSDNAGSLATFDAPDAAAVAWSPSGEYLATFDPTAGTIAIRRSWEGRVEDTLSVPKGTDLDAAAWAPDGKSLYLLRRVGFTDGGGSATLGTWVLEETPIDGSGGPVSSRPVGASVNPWLVGWRGGEPVVETGGFDRPSQFVVASPSGPRTLVRFDGRTDARQPSVAADLLDSAPVRDVEPRDIPWSSGPGLAWLAADYAPMLTVLLVLGALVFVGAWALGRRLRGVGRR